AASGIRCGVGRSGGRLTAAVCRSTLGLARSTREKVADVQCGISSCGVPRRSLADCVAGTGPRSGAIAAGVLVLAILLRRVDDRASHAGDVRNPSRTWPMDCAPLTPCAN